MIRKFFLVFLLLLIIGALGAAWVDHRIHTPYRGFSGAEVFVDLPSGIGVAGIARRLADEGVVPDALTFQIAARFSKADRHLQAGEYRFADAATPAEVVARIARGDVYAKPITFPEGHTIKEMAEIFARSGLGTAAEFETAAHQTSLVAQLDPGAQSLEGYLFPDTYPITRRAGADGTVSTMVDRFDHIFTPDLRAEAMAKNMSVHDVVTLASIIEKETGQTDERPLISAVYQNRLRLGMALQCDPTVIYGLMLAGKWNGNLTRQNLQFDSPYNTYKVAGLPPGPIASPGLASIEAALRPSDVKYLYFVSRNDGTHVFASTLEEHQRNVAKYQGRGRTR